MARFFRRIQYKCLNYTRCLSLTSQLPYCKGCEAEIKTAVERNARLALHGPAILG